MTKFSRRSWLSLAAGVGVTCPASPQQIRRPAEARSRRDLHYDVFTDKPITGNQLAVFTVTAPKPGAAGLRNL